MPIHISLHDVSPACDEEIEWILRDAAQFNIRPALLVVPNFHGWFPLADHPKFVARLRALQTAGHEVYLHGYYHLSGVGERPNGGGSPTSHSLSWLWNQRVVSRGEAEFFDLSRREALDRVERGIADLAAAGLTIDGFVPPAWTMPRWLGAILAAHDIRYTENHLHVMDPVTGRRQATVLVNFATRSKARMLSTVAYCRAIEPLSTRLPTRLAIHPSDYRVPLVRRQILRQFEIFAGHCVKRGVDLLPTPAPLEPGAVQSLRALGGTRGPSSS